MKFNKLFLPALAIIGFLACDYIKGPGLPEGEEPEPTESTAPYVGHWLSECITGDTRVYTEIGSDLKLKIAYLEYPSANCTGEYELTNGTNTITEPVHVQNLTEEIVENIPNNFYVLKYTNVNDSSVQYVILFANESEHYDLSGFTNDHSTWNQWLGEGDVFGFSENPTTFDPTSHLKVHFTASELP